MDGLICSFCGDRGCEACEIQLRIERINTSFFEKLAIATLEDIVRLFKDCSEEINDQALRGVIANHYAEKTLKLIRENNDEKSLGKS